MTKHEISIKVDTNDGDYATEVREISDSDLDKIKPLIVAIKKFKPYKTVTLDTKMDWTHTHNYPFGECLRPDLGEKSPREFYQGVVSEDTIELFEEFLPYNEYGFHTIVSIEVTPLVKKTKLL